MNRVTVIQMGPICGESPDGYNLVTVHGGRGLEDHAPYGGLVIIGHVVTGLESLVVSHAAKLGQGAPVVAFRPCHCTSEFWNRVEWVPIEDILEPDMVGDACVREQAGVVEQALRSLSSLPAQARG